MEKFITATKNGRKKRFSEYAWELLGENKGGWQELKDQTVSNEANKKPKADEPKASPKNNQVVDNEVEKKNDSQTVSNELEPTSTEEENTAENTDEQKTSNKEFISFAKENLKRGTIKDHLDSKDVKFKQSASLDELINLLYDFYKGDLNALKQTFNIQ